MYNNDIRVANTATPLLGETNVSQYGWTTSDRQAADQMVTYVNEAKAVWNEMEEKLLYVENLVSQLESSGGPDGLVLSVNGKRGVIELTAEEVNAISKDGVTPNGALTKRTLEERFGDHLSVKDFGAKGDGITDDTFSIKNAMESSANIYFPPGVYKISNLDVERRSFGQTRVKSITGWDATLKGNSCLLKGIRKTNISGLTFEMSDCTTIEDFRLNTVQSVDFGKLKLGRWSESGRATYSIYWNTFSGCLFSGIRTRSDIDSANFNSNTFDTCEFRVWEGTTDCWVFEETPNKKAVFSSNTFVGCDGSYGDVFNIKDKHLSWIVTWIGGFVDTGSRWFSETSEPYEVFDVIGARCPALETRYQTQPGSSIGMQSGGSRNCRYLPSGSVCYLRDTPKTLGENVVKYQSFPLPHSGGYSFSLNIQDISGVGLDAIVVENLTQASGKKYNQLEHSGFSTTTFTANKGDVIEITFDGKSGTNITVDSLTLSAGCGTPSAVSISDMGYKVSFAVDVDVKTKLIEIPINNYSQTALSFEIKTLNKTSNGAGLWFDEYILLASKTASDLKSTMDKVKSTSVGGSGGTSTGYGATELSLEEIQAGLYGIFATVKVGSSTGLTKAEVSLKMKNL